MKREPTVKFTLPPVSKAMPGPLYQQVIDGVKREICQGRLAPGTALPSFRQLAEELLVSLITVKRAYEELERDGIIFRKQGLGTYVSENGVARSLTVKHERAAALLDAAIQEGREAGMSENEIRALLRERLKGSEHE
jgi:GntR family transcriptional regulator